MKITLPLLLGAVFASSAFTAETPAPKPATLDDSEVRISYAELKKLLAAAQPPAAAATASKPPQPAALLSAVWVACRPSWRETPPDLATEQSNARQSSIMHARRDRQPMD